MIPIFIITCDRLKALEESIQSYYDCIKTPFEIVIIDFGSTFVPMIKYLRNLEHGIYHQKKVKIYWEEKIRRTPYFNNINILIQDYFKNHPKSNYVVTDPDIALDNAEGDILKVYEYFLENIPKSYAVGPMLRIDDIPDYYPRKKEVINWEMQFHSGKKRSIQYNERSIEYFIAGIDTTFGMNKAGTQWRRHTRRAIRVLAPYSARHLDWYLDPKNLAPDQEYYMKNAARKIGHWSRL